MNKVPLAPPSAPTYLWVVLGLSLMAATLPAVLPGPNGEGHAGAVPLMIVAAVAGMTLLMRRRLAYTLTPDALVITHLAGQTRLPYAGMTAWRTAGQLRLKVGGTGLPGYYTGHYTFSEDGLNTVLAASSAVRGGVIVQVGGRAYYLTPADPDAFLAELARHGATLTTP